MYRERFPQVNRQFFSTSVLMRCFGSVGLSIGFVVLLAGPLTAQTQEQELVARGTVFEDLDGDRKLTGTDRPMPGVRVSNGIDIVLTCDKGGYELPISPGGAVFVIKPRGFMTPVNELNLPRFFYLHKPAGSPALKYPGSQPTGPLPQSIDFPLYPLDEPDLFEVILFGDPQPRNVTEVDYIAQDVVRGLIGSQSAFGVTLGDIVFDDLSVMGPLNEAVALVGIPWYNVIGNHDVNTDMKTRELINETFENHYGPSYYSFDRGQVHFVVLDNIGWGELTDQPGVFQFRAEFGKQQLEFLRRDLALIPDEQMVVLMMHVPLMGTADTADLFRLIEDRPLCISLSAHTHNHTHVFFDNNRGWNGPQPHHHIVNVTVSGNWWAGKKDERGIPHTMMSDGGPNGHTVLRFNGGKYEMDYHAAGVEAGDQMRIILPEYIASSAISGMPMYVNVFNGSNRSQVEYRIDRGEAWTPMLQVEEYDPSYLALLAEDKLHEIFGGTRMGNANLSSHLWRVELAGSWTPGVHLIEVQTTDMHGRQFLGQRSIRVTGAGNCKPATVGKPEVNY